MDPATLEAIAREYGTPVYAYSEAGVLENHRRFKEAFASRYPKVKVLYAYKANTSLALCTILRRQGAGADVVSGGELHTALKVGVPAKDIIFSSNAKTEEELSSALDSGAVINIDSLQELDCVEKMAGERKKKARISFRINPGIDAKTHPKIATGLQDSKFGLHMEKDIALSACRKAKSMKHILIVGLQTHIGSQIREVSSFTAAAEKVMEFAYGLNHSLGIALEFIDLGGGLGVPYQGEEYPTPDDLALAVVPVIKKWGSKLGYHPELWLEPGRYLVANTGVLLSRVQSVKETPYKRFINLDAGFNTLIRPAMYDSYHRITVVGKEDDKPSIVYDVAGNVCESGDVFARDRKLPKVERGDLLAVLDAGAYGFVMASRYNSRLLPPEVLVRCNGSFDLIREREKMEDLYENQRIPKDLI